MVIGPVPGRREKIPTMFQFSNAFDSLYCMHHVCTPDCVFACFFFLCVYGHAFMYINVCECVCGPQRAAGEVTSCSN